MTSVESVEVVPAPLFWITGLAGVGKSTLAEAVVVELRRRGHKPLLLDGDTVRDALESADDAQVHHAAVRLRRAWRIAKLSRMATLQGVPVVVATISLFHPVHAWNRDGRNPYIEVFLDAPIESLRRRRPVLYGDNTQSASQNVVGIDIPPEFPRNPDLTIAQDFDRARLPVHVARVLAIWADANLSAATR